MLILRRFAINALIAASLVAAIIPRASWAAATSDPMATRVGQWEAVTLSQDMAGWNVESYKVSRNLVAWTELNETATQRKLYSWNGAKTTLLATLDVKDWYSQAGEEAFYDATLAGYDAADGLVVWIQWDGHDHEIMAWNGVKTIKVSNNNYDDRRPLTARGAIAWTSQPTEGGAYHLMWRDAKGSTRVLDTWQVMNYALSGDRLFWLNHKGNVSGFKVYAANKGTGVKAIGDGDDRPIKNYFLTDGRGAVAWEYSTKNWAYDKRVIWHSWDVVGAYQVVQRDVPPAETRLESVYGRRLTFNIKDWSWQKLYERTMLIEENDAQFNTIWHKAELAKLRYMDGGSIRHRENDGNSSLIFRGSKGSEDYVGLEYVIKDRFEADGPAAAGARVKGGLVVFADGKTNVIPTGAVVANLAVRDGDVAWIEGEPGSQKLRFATRVTTVGSKGTVNEATGYVAKAEGGKSLWLVTRDGAKYLFRNEGDFYAWNRDFNAVRTMPKASLDMIPSAGVVLAKPGFPPIKSAGSSRIYVMGADNRLHWITSADVLINQFGQGWQKKLSILPVSVFDDYAIGNGNISNDMEYLSTVNGLAE
jgi:hypothetical protein